MTDPDKHARIAHPGRLVGGRAEGLVSEALEDAPQPPLQLRPGDGVMMAIRSAYVANALVNPSNNGRPSQ